MKKFKVKVLEHEVEYKGKRQIPVWNSSKTVLFKSKRDAWNYFYNMVGENRVRDFWIWFGWDEKYVESVNMDEGGYSNVILYKWEGFDNDVELGWEYDGKLYHSVKELVNAFPQYFEGAEFETDRPFIRGEENQFADLHIEIKNADLQPKPKEEPVVEPVTATTDDCLPF